MEEPSRPMTAVARRWSVATVALSAITAIVVAVYITSLLDAQATTWLAPRLMQLAVYVLLVTALGVAGKWMTEQTKAHIDQRVTEAAARMDRRMDCIARTIGMRLDENTGEIKRVRADVELDGYAKGYADGLARTPITGVAKVARIGPPR
jgi:hypothetical protein